MTYDEFIENIIITRGQWSLTEDEYYEIHHILPKCLGGKGKIRAHGQKSNIHPNLIFLYPDEHFIAHKLLAVENPDNEKLVYAWSMMAFPKGKTKRNFSEAITADDYALLREMQARITYAKLKGREPWNKGLTKDTDARLRKLSEDSKGKNTWTKGTKRSEETRSKMSIASKKRWKDNPDAYTPKHKGHKRITNGVDFDYIDLSVDSIPEGWYLGGEKHSKYEIKDREQFCARISAQVSGENNPNYRHGERQSGGKNGHAIYIYAFEGVDYQCRDDLMVVLKQRWPNISESTIRRIMSGKYTVRISKKFEYIINNLTWRLKKDENKVD